MLEFRIDLRQTFDDDMVINTEAGFPVIYIGRGSYTGPGKLHTYHALYAPEEVHLIYIGRYTSIGDNLQVYCDINHDYRSVYMGVIPEYGDPSEDAPIRERIGQMTKRMEQKGLVVIGSDVWIGNDVSVISDVTIGNGAVIGAGSVVAKDIPPYTIWCGNPAVCIGKRFPDDISSGLQRISWWDYDTDRLKEIESDMKGEPRDLVTKYAPCAKDCSMEDPVFKPDNGLPTMVTFLDTDTDYPTFGDIIDQFITRFNDRSANLVLCYDKYKAKDKETMDALSGTLAKLNGRVNLYPLEADQSEEENIIAHSDTFVLGRDIRNIRRISYALKYGLKCLSGANKPIFNKKIKNRG